MKRLLAVMILLASFISCSGAHETTSQADVKGRVAELRTLWQELSKSSQKDLKEFSKQQYETFEKMQAAWRAKRNDLGARIITPLLKDLEGARIPKDMLPLLEKRMIALFKENFSFTRTEGGAQALNVVLYEHLKGPDITEELRNALGNPLAAWDEALDPKGRIVTYWQLFLIEKLAGDKGFKAIKKALSSLKEGYKELHEGLSAITMPGSGPIVTKFLTDPIWQEYKIEQSVLTHNRPIDFRLWAISNDGFLYYANKNDSTAASYFLNNGELHVVDALSHQMRVVTNLPLSFLLKPYSCLVETDSRSTGGISEIFKIDLNESEAIPLNFTIPQNMRLLSWSYDGATLLLQSTETQQITIRNNKGEFPLPHDIIHLIVSSDGNVVVGFKEASEKTMKSYWFSGLNGKLQGEQEYKTLNEMDFYSSTLSEDGSVIAFFGKKLGRTEHAVIIRNSPLSGHKASPSDLSVVSPYGPLKLYGNGEILLFDRTLYFLNSGIKVKYPDNAAYPYPPAISTQGKWIAFLASPGSESFDYSSTNNVVYVWNISPSAANQLAKELDDIDKGRARSLTKQSKLNLLKLYDNPEIVDIPKKWKKVAEGIRKKAKTK